MARISAAEMLKNTKNVELHREKLRIVFWYKRIRCRENTRLPLSIRNLKYAANLLATVTHEIATNRFDYARHFPDSKNAERFSGKPAAKTVRDLVETYKDIKYLELNASTQRRYDHAFTICTQILGERRLIESLRHADIAALRKELISCRASSTANHYMSAFRPFLSFAQRNRYTDEDLSSELRPFPLDRREPDPLSREEFLQLRTAYYHPCDENLFTLAIYTGLRTQELAALAWEDVDFDAGQLTVRRALSDNIIKLPKTNEERVVDLLPPALEALESQRKYTDSSTPLRIEVHLREHNRTRVEFVRPVFSPKICDKAGKAGDWMKVHTIRTKWRSLLRRAKIPHRNVYQTRHTYACWLLTAGANLAYIAKQLGHRDYSMLIKTYGRWLESETKNESARVWEAMKNTKSVPTAPMLPPIIENKT